MKKTLLKELVLPSFWVFFFIVSPNKEEKIQIKISDGNEWKKQADIFGATEDDKAKEIRFTKAVYLSGF